MKTAQVENDKIIIKNTENITLNNKKGAIVKLIGSGLCGSDIVKFRQKLVKNGTVLGHEIVGEIIEINSDTEFKIGDKIVSAHHIPCFNCEFCKSGHYSMCKHFKSTNIIPGGFSEYIYLSEEHLKNVAHLIPKELNEVEASFMEPLACCIRAINRANLQEKETVLVIGLGSIGILMGQALKAYGHNVFGSDLIKKRLEISNKLGIKTFDKEIKPSAVFLTAGADATIDFALKSVRDGGKIIVFASTPKNFGYANNEIYYRELTVMGSYSPSPNDLKEALNLLKTKKVNVENLSTIYEFDKIEQAIKDTVENKILKAYIKL